MSIPFHQRPYLVDEKFKDRLLVATKVVEAVNQVPGRIELRREARRRVFKEVVWMVTEGAGKYSTRYRSKMALLANKEDVQHEHVFPIRHLYYLSNHGLSVENALSLCCGCIVTRQEHGLLTMNDRSSEAPLGWRRYQFAGIQVMDLLENRPITLAEMEAATVPFEKAMRESRFCGDGETDLELERLS